MHAGQTGLFAFFSPGGLKCLRMPGRASGESAAAAAAAAQAALLQTVYIAAAYSRALSTHTHTSGPRSSAGKGGVGGGITCGVEVMRVMCVIQRLSRKVKSDVK